MSIAEVLEKYGEPEGIEYKPPELVLIESEDSDWQESKPTVALFEYLKSRADLGVSLVMQDGDLTLHFEPGLNKESAERWAFAEKAIDLLAEAKEDILFMIDWQMLSLPVID